MCYALWKLAPTKIRLNSPWALHLPAWRGCDHWICWMVRIAISIWCNHCQLCQKCVHRTPPHGPNSSLVTPWATICSFNLQLAIFFSFGLGKRADSKFIFIQRHLHTWLISPTVKGLERNTTAAGRWCLEAQGNCCPGWIEVLKSNTFSGASYFQIILSFYCFVFSLPTLILNRRE